MDLADGGVLELHLFKHYPHHGKMYHLHTVYVRDKNQVVHKITYFHEGAEHEDVPKDDPDAWIYNDKREMAFPCRGKVPPAAVHHDHDAKPAKQESHNAHHVSHEPTHHSEPLPPPYSEHSDDVVTQTPATMYSQSKAAAAQRAEMKEQLLNSAVKDANNNPNPNCCPCM
jgi:hypothetical protein